MDSLMVLLMARLRADPVADRVGYHAICARVIPVADVKAVTTAAQAGLPWSGALIVVMGWRFGGVG